MTVPLPPVEQVRPGLWSIPVPLPMSSLRYVLVYAFETDAGVYLVDAGWNTDEAFTALEQGLAEAGMALTDARGVLVTHIHPDHYGLAGRIRAASGAWVGLHPADAELVETRYEQPAELLTQVRSSLERAGAPHEELDSLENASMPLRPFVDAVTPDHLIEDGDAPEVPGWDVRAIWTPGHSPGHLCFHLDKQELLLSGDHILPRITPNIAYHPQSGPDPLGDFLRSLDKVAVLDVSLVLPAHEHRFVSLLGRIEELKAHHEARFAEILTAVGNGIDTTWDLTASMTWSRSWERLEGFMRRAALGEARAHLAALVTRGQLYADEGTPTRWRLTDAAAAG